MLKDGKEMESMNDTKFVSIFQPYDATQAGFIRDALEQADIVCYVNNENISGMRFGGMGIGAGSMAVMVPKDRAEEAIGIIKALGIQ